MFHDFMTNKMWRHDFYENFLVPTACRLRLSFHQSVVGHDGSSILAWNDLKINSSQWRYFGAIFEYEKSTSGYETVELSWTSFQFVISRSAREHHLVIFHLFPKSMNFNEIWNFVNSDNDPGEFPETFARYWKNFPEKPSFVSRDHLNLDKK